MSLPIKFFKPEYFNSIVGEYNSKEETLEILADIANRILTERGVRVYGHEDSRGYVMCSSSFPENTHQALLVCIEELPKKECEHAPIITLKNAPSDLDDWACSKCGAKLRAKWEPA